MAKGTYTYEPANISIYGKDRMRFELGDTMIEGGSDTTALTDEEIQAAIDTHQRSWKKAKLMLLESLYHRFAYEVDTRTGPLSLSFHDRAKLWKEEYEALKKKVSVQCSIPNFDNSPTVPQKQPYFYTGMQQNERAGMNG